MISRRKEYVNACKKEFVKDITDPVELILTKIMIAEIFNHGNLAPRVRRYIRKNDIKTASDFINMELTRDRHLCIGDTTLNYMIKIQNKLKFYKY